MARPSSKGTKHLRRGTQAEASPSDRIWVIGLHECNARNAPASQWPRMDLLGLTLTRVQEEMLGSEDRPQDVTGEIQEEGIQEEGIQKACSVLT